MKRIGERGKAKVPPKGQPPKVYVVQLAPTESDRVKCGGGYRIIRK